MKHKIKKISYLASALCAVVATAGLMSACGESVDYTNYTYDDYAAITYSQWDKKTISYQIVSPIEAKDRIEAGFDLYTQILFNLYSDGSVLIFQAGLYYTSATMPDAAWYDVDEHISWAQFGQWESSDDGSVIDVYCLTRISPEGTVVEKTQSWGDSENFKYHIQLTKTSSGDYTYAPGENNAIQLFGLNLNGEGMTVDLTLTSKSGSSVEYKTIQSWIDTYMDEEETFEEK